MLIIMPSPSKVCIKCPPKPFHLLLNTSTNTKTISGKVKCAALLKYNRSMR